MKKVLVAGGAGYIGSHTIVELFNSNNVVVSVDNYSNSNENVYKLIYRITGKHVENYQLNLCDKEKVLKLFDEHRFDAIIQFAGHKAVGESIEKPIKYYYNNVISTLNLAEASVLTGVKQFVFSSSATVYGKPQFLPYTEDHPIDFATNPYGNSKIFIEKMLEEVHAAHGLNVVLLRYFNPVGAHDSGLIGDNPKGSPNNLMPYICQTAAGVRGKLSIYGNDYDTPDGTCLRDFIHVADLAKGHISALKNAGYGLRIFNLGTGVPTSVLELVTKFQEVNGVQVPFAFAPRRAGDLPECWADTSKAEKELDWKAELGLERMVEDSWRWQLSLA